jgi:tetratricopeptide (TPR) repeat protein
MTTLIDTQKFDNYLDQVQAFTIRMSKEENVLAELLNLIENQQIEWCEIPSYEEFFNGEIAFFKQEYEQALKYYLQARQIPYFQFFCYRASAFVSKAIGNTEKAISFGRKALKFFPEDYLLLNLLKELLSSESHKESVQEIDQKLFSLEQDEPNAEISLGEKEASELSQIFEPHREVHQDLFFEEQLQTTPKNFTDLPSYDFSSIHTLPTTLPEVMQATQSPTFTHQDQSSLDTHIESFQKEQNQKLKEYLEQLHKRVIPNQCLFILNGNVKENFSSLSLDHFFLTERSRKASGGFYLRWNSKGIVINPGRHFLRHFHEQGLHICDIDYVIVTQENPEAYADIKEIHDLASQINKIGLEAKPIHYYLNQKAYQELAQALKPTYKQARNTLHSLDLFIDSAELEKVELNHEICLHYFALSSDPRGPNHLGIRLDLRDAQGKEIYFGYVSGATSAPMAAQHLKQCDVIVGGFGNSNDEGNHAESLGYFGSLALMQEATPRLFLCTEFGGREGDTRIEIAKKLRAESQFLAKTVVLPGDVGLLLDLEQHHVQCSFSQKWVSPGEIRALKSKEPFGKLAYLSSECYL